MAPSHREVVRQLAEWARSRHGTAAALESMRLHVPFVRAAFRSERRRMERERAGARATRAREPWTRDEVRRVAEGMRRGEGPERAATELGRSVPAVNAMRGKIRRRCPERLWKPCRNGPERP